MKSIYDAIIIGAGAAGLMTAITAKRAGVSTVLLLDAKEKIGAKILMSGGTRCNLTNEAVSEKDFETEQKNILKSPLKYFSSEKAVAFFQELGIEVVKEEGGKFFPSTHSGRDVLEALEREIQKLGIELETPRKVTTVEFRNGHFVVRGGDFRHEAKTVVLTTGGLSFPATGSDGSGYGIAQTFGHRLIETSPSLTPLTSEDPDFKTLTGLSLPVRLSFWLGGKKQKEYEGSFLFTHFGFSGPVVLDISRHWIRGKDQQPMIQAHFIPSLTEEKFTQKFMRQIEYRSGRQLQTFLTEFLPIRFIDVLLKKAGIMQGMGFNQLKKTERQELMRCLFRYPLPVAGHLGYAKAEVTAGGVDLAEVHRKNLESKFQPGLFFAGEILDVDGRIGGFNFQWAWSSGTVAGHGIAAFLKNPARE